MAAPPNDTNVVLKLKESVKDNWSKLSAWCSKVTALRSEMGQLPDSAWFGSAKKSQRELIRVDFDIKNRKIPVVKEQ